MRVGYSRVSTKGQDHGLQLDALRAAGCDHIQIETASGATMADRPVLSDLLDDLSEGDTLVVWRLDRLARNLRELIETADDLRARKIALQSLTEQIDTSTPQGRLFFNFFGIIGQFERDLIAERTRAGLEAARAKGRRGGRKPALNDAEVARARELLANGKMKQAEVARVMRVSPATLSRALRQVEGSTYAK